MGAIRGIVQRFGVDGLVETYETTVRHIDDYYKELDCRLFDVVYWSVNGVEVTIFCDDEWMLRSKNFGRYVLNEQGERLVPLFGNLLILGMADDEGETLPLDERVGVTDVNNATELHCGLYATLITK